MRIEHIRKMDELHGKSKDERYRNKTTNLLNSYGDVIELDWEFDVPQIL